MSSLVARSGTEPFLLAFEESLRKLNLINAAITKNTENKNKFTGDVLNKLKELHEKIKLIVIKITEIKQKIEALQAQVDQNTSGVQTKEAELTNLKQQLAQLTSEKNDLTSQLDQERADASANATRLQTLVDTNEAQLRDCMAKNVELETTKRALEEQINGIRADIQNNGDAQTQAHAAELQRLSDEHAAAIKLLNDQIADNQRQIAENQTTIAANEAKIQELTDQHGTKDTQTQDLVNSNKALETSNNELDAKNKDLETRLNGALTDYNNLQARITQLETELEDRTLEGRTFLEKCEQEKEGIKKLIDENKLKIRELEAIIIDKDSQIAALQQNIADANTLQQAKEAEIVNLNNTIIQITNEKDKMLNERDDLRRRIEEATIVIDNASNNLAELTNQQFYEDSMDAVNTQIGEIERTLELINSEIQVSLNSRGASITPVIPPSGPLSGPVPPQAVNLDNLQIFGKNISLTDLLSALNAKSNASSDKRMNKYKGAASDINFYINNTARNNNDSQAVIQQKIEEILRKRNVVDTSNGNIRGGYNKTKKFIKKYGKSTRKQKGGFLYGKYKNTGKTSTTSSVSSSSSYNNTFKKNKKPKSKGLSRRKRI